MANKSILIPYDRYQRLVNQKPIKGNPTISCPFCTDSFSRKDVMLRHVRNKHRHDLLPGKRKSPSHAPPQQPPGTHESPPPPPPGTHESPPPPPPGTHESPPPPLNPRLNKRGSPPTPPTRYQIPPPPQRDTLVPPQHKVTPPPKRDERLPFITPPGTQRSWIFI